MKPINNRGSAIITLESRRFEIPSESVLESIVNTWKIFICIESDSQIAVIFVKGSF